MRFMTFTTFKSPENGKMGSRFVATFTANALHCVKQDLKRDGGRGRDAREEVLARALPRPARAVRLVQGVQEVLYSQPTGLNPLSHREDFIRPALRHGKLNSLFKVA